MMKMVYSTTRRYQTLIGLFIISPLLWISCQQSNTEQQAVSQVDPCGQLKDTFSVTSVFGSADTALAKKDFQATVQFIESKGNLRQVADKGNERKTESWTDIYLPHYIDTCDNKHVTQLFVLKNVVAYSCNFRSLTPLKGDKSYFPRFYFAQWNFGSNTDRDSVYKIMQWVYLNGGTEYTYKYNQTVVAEKKLYLIEPGAKIFEATSVEYAGYLKQLESAILYKINN